MRVVHVPESGTPETLATEVELAESAFEQGRGLMLRQLPEDGAIVFPFDRAKRRGIHTFLVPAPIDVVWTVEGEVDRVATLRAWAGLARGRGDTVIELPAGTAAGVEAGDGIRIESSP